MAIPISSSISQVDPNLLFYQGYELALEGIIPSSDYTSSFVPGVDRVEFFIYNTAKNVLYENGNFQDYIVANNTATQLAKKPVKTAII